MSGPSEQDIELRRQLVRDPHWPAYRRYRSSARRWLRARGLSVTESFLDSFINGRDRFGEFVDDMRELLRRDAESRGVAHLVDALADR